MRTNRFFKKAAALSVAVAVVLALLLGGAMLGFFQPGAKARAEEPAKSVRFLPDTVEDFNALKSSVIADFVEVSHEPGHLSYVLKDGHAEFVFHKGVDVSALDEKKLALSFWVFSSYKFGEMGDNQIEVSSSPQNHDANEYSWAATDVLRSASYIPGKWNRAILPMTNFVGTVGLSDINYFRMYYLGVTHTEPVLISDFTFIETDRYVDTPGADRIAETVDAPNASFDTVEMPTGLKENEIFTAPIVAARDITGQPISFDKISVSVLGPNGYLASGKQIVLEDGGGVYTVTYSAFDALGQTFTKSFELLVAASDNDTTKPKITVEPTIPIDFMVGKSFDLKQFINIRDNRGQAALSVEASIVDGSGGVNASFSGKATAFALSFAPDKKTDYFLKVTATDEAKNSTEFALTLCTYLPAGDASVSLFDFENGDYEILTGGKYSGRLIDARPTKGQGKSIEFNYGGGATNTTDNSTFRQELAVVNNNPAELSGIDMRWACLKMWIYIDRSYSNDGQWMPSNGTGYGNLGIGIASSAGIFNIPRMEYGFNRMGLTVGWNELTIKLGREFDGKVDLSSISEIYMVTNFGASRRILLNDIRIVEDGTFSEGLLSIAQAGDEVNYFKKGEKEAVGASSAEIWNTDELYLQQNYYLYTEVKMPGLKLTDFMGSIGYVLDPTFVITDPDGVVSGSQYFTPMATGTHTMTMTAKDYYGQEVTLTQTFEVLGANAAPVITLSDTKNLRCRLGGALIMPDIKAADEEGEAVTVTVKVYAPDGSLMQAKNGKYITALTGLYRVTVLAKDEVGQLDKQEFTVTVYTTTESVYDKNYTLKITLLSTLVPVGILLLAFAALLIVCRIKRIWIFKAKAVV